MIRPSLLILLVHIYFWFGKCHCLPTAALKGHLWNFSEFWRALKFLQSIWWQKDGMAQCCAQEGLEGKCSLEWLLGQEGVPGHWAGSATSFQWPEWDLCPALCLSTGSCLFPDTGFTVQQLNSLFLPLYLELLFPRVLTMQVLEEHTEIQVLQQVLNSMIALKSLQ